MRGMECGKMPTLCHDVCPWRVLSIGTDHWSSDPANARVRPFMGILEIANKLGKIKGRSVSHGLILT